MAGARTWPKGFDPENPECPRCQGAMYDNRNDPKRKKGMPHFRCKDKACVDDSDRVTGVWGPDDPAKPKVAAGDTVGTVSGGAAYAPTPKYNFTPAEKAVVRKARIADYLALMQNVKDGMTKIALGKPEAMVALDMGNVQAATFSLWGDLKTCGALRDPAVIVQGARHRGELEPAPVPAKPAPKPAAPAKVKEPEPEPEERELAGVGAGKGRPPLKDTGSGAQQIRKDPNFEEFPSALNAEDDDLPF